MKIVICGSMSSAKQMIDAYDRLREKGHEVVLPRHTQEYANKQKAEENHQESIKHKIEGDLIREYFEEIRNSDGIIVVNCVKNGIAGYIGGNTFLEMGFAHVLGKKIYLQNGIPDLPYADEIIAMRPVLLDGDLSKIS